MSGNLCICCWFTDVLMYLRNGENAHTKKNHEKIMQLELLIKKWFEFGMHSHFVILSIYYGNLGDATKRVIQNKEMTRYERNEHHILFIFFDPIDFIHYYFMAENLFRHRFLEKRKQVKEHTQTIHWAK